MSLHISMKPTHFPETTSQFYCSFFPLSPTLLSPPISLPFSLSLSPSPSQVNIDSITQRVPTKFVLWLEHYILYCILYSRKFLIDRLPLIVYGICSGGLLYGTVSPLEVYGIAREVYGTALLVRKAVQSDDSGTFFLNALLKIFFLIYVP